MVTDVSELDCKTKTVRYFHQLYNLLATRAYTAILLGALFCTLAVKFFHAYRMILVNEYFSWILADIAVLLGIEAVLALVCYRWPRKWIIRVAVLLAAIVCTWSVMNAGWVVRTGTQILPQVLLSLIRDPISALSMVGVNLIKMPKAAVMLLGPSAIALAFFFSVLAKAPPPGYDRKGFANRIGITVTITIVTALAYFAVVRRSPADIISAELRYNCHVKALTSFAFFDRTRLARADFANAKRKIPAFDEMHVNLKPQGTSHNVVIVVLEGIQYRYTSLAEEQEGGQGNLTPFLAKLAAQGVEFENTRSTIPHTTKALFALLTGRFPSASQDIAESVPAVKPYAGLATILAESLDYRSAFFQSAEGRFECAPGLVHNVGFDKFWAKEDMNDPNCFLGYFSCDEFALLEPVVEWIESDDRPFLLTFLCSVTHDPYEVPEWYGEQARDLVERYRQTISYTDSFLAALDTELTKLNLADRTIFCVISDHGEAFGEHGLFAHERIAFEEALRIPWVLRAPCLAEPGKKITEPVGSIDLTPTVLNLLGFNLEAAGFDGVNALGHIPDDRKVYFSCWMQAGPAGYVQGRRKFIYSPTDKTVCVYDLSADPLEAVRIELPDGQAQRTAEEIIAWRKSSIFRPNQKRTGKTMLFDSWLCRWSNRVSSATYRRGARPVFWIWVCVVGLCCVACAIVYFVHRYVVFCKHRRDSSIIR